MLPSIIYTILFCYVPMYGIQIAFRNFIPKYGITGSPWVGLKHFARFLESPQFLNLIKNTLSINILSLMTFPLPIILALMLSYCISKRYSKIVQMITYAPHFISVVIIVAMVNIFFSESIGPINNIRVSLGLERVNFLAVPQYFKYLYVFSGTWQGIGWGSIIYIGALTGVSPELHEAAIVDGANKLNRIWHIDIPGILPTVMVMLVMSLGQIMSLGFQKIFLMQNPVILGSSEVISTYVYKVGMLQSNFSYSTSIGLFNTIINLTMLLIANYTVKKCSNISLF